MSARGTVCSRRYHQFHGKLLRHPITDSLIPLVVDESVDAEFGTGAVKITPAHDRKDFDIGRKHNLP